MGGSRLRLLVSLVAVAVLVAGVAGQAWAEYTDPDWAPDWFKACTGLKQWAQWDEGESTYVKDGKWKSNYEVPEAAYLFLSETSLTVAMKNVERPQWFKQLWMKITYTAQGNMGFTDLPRLFVGGVGWQEPLTETRGTAGPGNQGFVQGYEGDGVFSTTLYAEIWPQPPFESVSMSWSNEGLTVKKVMILTQCNPIPEPVFFQMGALLGLSGLGMLKLRRR